MTNEELCRLIKEGDNGYLPQLWEQVRKLIVMKAKQYLGSRENIHGIELDDLIQSGYFAVLRAVHYYEPKKGLKFTTFLNFTLKNTFREEIGIRTSKRNPLNDSYSLDWPLVESGDLTLLDTIADLTPGSGSVEAEIVESVYLFELRGALDEALGILDSKNRQRVELYYYFNLSYENIAQIDGTSKQLAEQRISLSLMRIRRSKYKKILESFLYWYGQGKNYYRNTGYQAWKNSLWR